MIGPDSRYAELPTATHVDRAGRETTYVTRRLLPDPATLTVRRRVAVVDGDRLDLVAHRALGDASAWWLLPEANPSLHPDELLAEPGRLLTVAVLP